EEPAVHVETVGPDTAAQLVARLDERCQHREQLGGYVRGKDLRSRQQTACGEHAAPAAGPDVEDAHLTAVFDAGKLETTVDQLDEIQAVEIALVVRRSVADELLRDSC